jgi:hypothetical protein
VIDPDKSLEKVVGALQGFPMLLVLVLLNLTGLALVGYLINSSAQLRFKERAELVEALRECAKLRADKINANG